MLLPVFETLESREFLSASVVKQVTKAATPAAKKAAVQVSAPAPAPVAWNDLAGKWTGIFYSNVATPKAFTASFQNRWGKSNTGTFNLSAMIGQSNLLTTTTPDAYGNVLITVPVKGGFVSFVSGISPNGQVITGRWCSRIGSTFTEGFFTMHRA
jgi:hypothetical protein